MVEMVVIVVFLSLFEAYADRGPRGYSLGVRFRWYRLATDQLKRLASTQASQSQHANGGRLREEAMPF